MGSSRVLPKHVQCLLDGLGSRLGTLGMYRLGCIYGPNLALERLEVAEAFPRLSACAVHRYRNGNLSQQYGVDKATHFCALRA